MLSKSNLLSKSILLSKIKSVIHIKSVIQINFVIQIKSVTKFFIIKLSFLLYYLVCLIWFIQKLKEWVVKGKSEKHHTKAYIKSIKHKCTTIKERNTWVDCGEVLKSLFKITVDFLLF